MSKVKGVDLEDYIPNKEIKGEYDTSLAVKCNNGIFVGIKNDNVISYKGIPYAEPPIKQLRFKPPIKAPDSDKVYEAYNLGKAAFQSPCDTELSSYFAQGEDCLTLNIWKIQYPEKNSTIPEIRHVSINTRSGFFLSL